MLQNRPLHLHQHHRCRLADCTHANSSRIGPHHCIIIQGRSCSGSRTMHFAFPSCRHPHCYISLFSVLTLSPTACPDSRRAPCAADVLKFYHYLPVRRCSRTELFCHDGFSLQRHRKREAEPYGIGTRACATTYRGPRAMSSNPDGPHMPRSIDPRSLSLLWGTVRQCS